MLMSSRSLGKITSALFVGALLLYMLAGVNLAPFHGDESSIIDMSRDWYRLVVDHDLASVLYRPDVVDKARDDQNLRLLNGVLSKYGIGIATSIAGIPAKDLVTGWAWGQDWYTNQYYNHIAVNPLLFIARMSSVLMAMVSVALAFRIGFILGGFRVATIATVVYATLPAVLLNGRRAMFEGAFLLATSLLILAALRVARQMQTDTRWRRWLLFGVALGLAPAAKHTALLPAIPILAVILWLGRKHWLQTLKHVVVSLVIAGAVFFALTPAWWNHPLQMPSVVLKMRQDMLALQTIPTSLYQSTSGRVRALVDFTLGSPQYFEEQFSGPQGWQDWIRQQINSYEASGLTGLPWNRLGVIAWLLIALGLAAMFRLAFAKSAKRQCSDMMLTFLATTIFSVIAIFVLTPLTWQRYYLPLALLLSVSLSQGIVTLIQIIEYAGHMARTESLSQQ
jgi:4-amino-4-deoxy-L-arabinose transferase-like glycosyltransferase